MPTMDLYSAELRERAKVFLLEQAGFDRIPEALKHLSFAEVILRMEALAVKHGDPLANLSGRVQDAGPVYNHASHYVNNLRKTFGGAARNVHHRQAGAVRVYGSDFQPGIDEAVLTRIAEHYGSIFSPSEFLSFVQAEENKPVPYKALALQFRNRNPDVGAGIMAVMGKEFDYYDRIAANDPNILGETVRNVADQLNWVVPKGRRLITTMTGIDSTGNEVLFSARGDMHLNTGVILGLIFKAQDAGKEVGDLVKQEIVAGRLEPKSPKMQKMRSADWTSRSGPNEIGRAS